MKPNELIDHLKGVETEVKHFINDLAPVIAGKVAVDAFTENFYNEAFFDEPWQEVQRRTPGTAANRYATDTGRTRSILTGTGDLGRSIEVQRADNAEAVIWSNPNVFTSRDPYGAVHNEGLHAGRGSGFTMPKRQFIGDHPVLRERIRTELHRKLKPIIEK